MVETEKNVMAYLHCHSCDWSQDDFYSKSYSLWTKMLADAKWLWKPRFFTLDTYIIKDLIEYTGVKVWTKETVKGQTKVFSWNWWMLEIVKDIKNYHNTKWKTWEAWKKAKDTAVCPQCGDTNFDID